MNLKQSKFKRGQKVKVVFEGIIINSFDDIEANKIGSTQLDGYRISVKLPKMKNAWWAVVPKEVVSKK